MRVTHAGLHLCRTGTFKMQDVFDMVYSLLVFVNIRVILYKTYVVLICGKYNTLTLEFKINIAICVPLQMQNGMLNNVHSNILIWLLHQCLIQMLSAILISHLRCTFLVLVMPETISNLGQYF